MSAEEERRKNINQWVEDIFREQEEPVRVHQLQAIANGVTDLVNDIRRDNARTEVRIIEKNLKKEQLDSVSKCDGLVPAETRNWLQECDFAIEVLRGVHGSPAYISSKSSIGSLHREIELYLQTQPDRDLVSWGSLKDYITKTFVSANESERLRSELDNIKQKPDETITLFNRRFKELARQAYPNNNADTKRVILRAYIKSLKDQSLARKIVVDRRSTNLDDAVKYAEEQMAGIDLLETMGIQDEPMEVGSFKSKSIDSVELKKQRDECTKLRAQNEKLFSRLSKVEAQYSELSKRGYRNGNGNQGQRRDTQTPSNRRPKWTASGEPICLICNQPNHMQYDCPQNIGNSRFRGNGYNQQRGNNYQRNQGNGQGLRPPPFNHRGGSQPH